ncbi:hypothetical protein [Carboxylicivirga marina]|uniref:hypothetical protein n=1 Tax=Carboxylicivirga marina TaxID=2800988 RepID=UPI002597AE8F|nr:hypothetical protein [uncultured Carboxylicivirga sp.]
MKAIKNERGNIYLLIKESAVKTALLSPREISGTIGLYHVVKNKINLKYTVFDTISYQCEVTYINQINNKDVIANYSYITNEEHVRRLIEFYELYNMKASKDPDFYLSGIINEHHTCVQVFDIENPIVAKITTEELQPRDKVKARGRGIL